MTKATSQVVYTSTARKAPGSVVRYHAHGLRHRQITRGGKYITEINIGHEWVMVLNHELPQSRVDPGQYIAHPQDGRCACCGYIYTHLMTNADQPCDECRLEHMAEMGSRLQRLLGIDLGWHTTDHEGQRHDHNYHGHSLPRPNHRTRH